MITKSACPTGFQKKQQKSYNGEQTGSPQHKKCLEKQSRYLPQLIDLVLLDLRKNSESEALRWTKEERPQFLSVHVDPKRIQRIAPIHKENHQPLRGEAVLNPNQNPETTKNPPEIQSYQNTQKEKTDSNKKKW